MLLAFFPEYRLNYARSPSFDEIVGAYRALRGSGLRSVRVGNTGVFCKTRECLDKLIETIGRDAVAL